MKPSKKLKINLQTLPTSISDDLLGNNIPYPSNFDGQRWQSCEYYTRKSLPSYLRNQLPKQKFRKVRETFQSMNKFTPPEITFFQKMIKPVKHKSSKIRSFRQEFKKIKQNSSRQNTIRVDSFKKNSMRQFTEDFQYSMMVVSPASHVLIDLLEKVEQQKRRQSQDFGVRLISSKRSAGGQNSFHKCFDNTGSIVFGLRKRELTRRKISKEKVWEPNEEVKSRINSIRLWENQ